MPDPLIIDREHEIGAVLWHVTGYGPGVVLGYQVTEQETRYFVRWGGSESESLVDDFHAAHELTVKKPVTF